MPSYEQSISDQYGQSDLSSKILTALQDAGKDIDSLTTNDLSSFDQHHSGGLAATRELASLVGLREGIRVLDVGSGVGGPARTLATEYGCDVTGIDLTEEYCLAAEMLTARLGLEARVRFHCGSALDMPFDDGTFDVVWMQNSSMNIPDKENLYSEVRRVLRIGGSLATQDVLSGAVEPLYYPVPWAADSSLSSMIGAEDLRNLLGQLGFIESAWIDGTELAMKSAKERVAAASAESPSPISQVLFVSQDVRETMENTLRNYEEGRALIVMSVFERS
ncbi:MAG: methyltransferase domain-containing protein [Chloroflexi bacterium]|nr:methyltransferase domain-containing protein [Chloroflexota bacterium]